MTETTRPPNRPTTKPPARAGRGDAPRGGDKPRARSTGGHPRDAGRQDAAAKTRGAEPAPPKDDARIAKVMARAGLCSRRDAEGWIAAGRVAVNGTVIDSPALNVKPGDQITVDGQPLPEREQTRLYMFHKPRGLVTTARDPEGRPTIFDNLPPGLPRLVSVGRLDINTEGLMLLTNDGGLARVLELPATGWLRRYRVRANGEIDQARLDGLKHGVTIDGVAYAGIEATLDRIKGANAWITMGLREGKNREIKRVLETLGLAVTRLIRVSFGPFQLGELAEGAVEAVPTRVLRDQLGPALAAEAGVDLADREEPGRGTRDTGAAAPLRPRRSEPPPPRPHVSALRTARSEEDGEGRRRIERGATADRKGRAVAIERVIPVGSGSERGEDSRNARRFASEKRDHVAGRQRTRAEAGSPRRIAEGAARPRRDDDARPPRAAERPARPRRDDDARPARAAERPARPRRDDDARPPRGAEGPARPRRDDDARPARGAFGGKPRGERADGFEGKARGERSGGFGERPRGERAGGSGERPRGERAGGSGERPRGGKPGGRPGGFGSDRPVTGRNKSERGERPGGGGPAGGGAAPRGGKPGGSRPRGGGKPSGGRP